MSALSDTGVLYIVSTPIGNTGDITARAVERLASACLVACEDTRHTGRLLSRLGIKNRLMSYNDNNAERRVPAILDILASGGDVAIVSDAGTPGVSDPAYRIVRAAIDAGFDVMSVPGPSAVLAALVVSGLPLDRFVFEGFLPRKGAKRTRHLESLAHETRTIVLYESPYRIVDLLDRIHDILGDRDISVSRELTKLHEETVRGPVSRVLETVASGKPRGEYTVVIRGVSRKDAP